MDEEREREEGGWVFKTRGDVAWKGYTQGQEASGAEVEMQWNPKKATEEEKEERGFW